MEPSREGKHLNGSQSTNRLIDSVTVTSGMVYDCKKKIIQILEQHMIMIGVPYEKLHTIQKVRKSGKLLSAIFIRKSRKSGWNL